VSGPGTAFTAVGVTIVAGGAIQIGANGTSVLSAAGGVPNGIAVFSGDTTCAGPSINLGFQDLTITGSVYAPGGCINVGGTNMKENGSIIGNTVAIGAGPAGFTFDPTGDPTTNNWQMLQ
jgi:hypothetical protein